ncbi:MAG: UDP-glucose--hexose-1-phosphate uridylyltransferase [Clostridiales bacterium]|nr:UDP-glucose--hexose-1-phosphate uridylyltransferase [Clostridiales bacterium]
MIKNIIEELLGFALKNELIFTQDVPYCRNLIMDALDIDVPAEGYSAFAPKESEPQRTAFKYLEAICDYAAEKGIIKTNTQTFRELFSAKIMGLISLPPSTLESIFNEKSKNEGVAAATTWFYNYCRANNYIQVDAIEKNIAFTAPSQYGDLDITINLSKPEKDPKDIAAAKLLPQTGYPACLLCVENTGHPGNASHPARQNHRMLPITIGGKPWHMQYSPYLYYNEHCIALNDEHVPMKISRETFEKLLDFVENLPHYFIGSNADLPIVGGSILSHDHFQGGGYVFPMDKAPCAHELTLKKYPQIKCELAAWPMTCIRLDSADREALVNAADEILAFWRGYSDDEAGVLAYTDQPHNTITPIARKTEGGYRMSLVLRNNRTDEDNPLGIFHPHSDLHHIKKENIGLIEVMGLFILPGRLKTELKAVENALCGMGSMEDVADIHKPWFDYISKKYGKLSAEEAEKAVRAELSIKCARVLFDAGVYKLNEEGFNAFMRFWNALNA